MPRKTVPNIARSLMAASRAHTSAVMAQLAKLGYEDFPFASASLLWLIDEEGTRSTVLAQRAGVSKQAVSRLVRVMEKQGYLEQVSDPTDTRAKTVRMTERGQAVKEACVEVRDDLNRRLAALLKVSGAAVELEKNLDAVASLLAEVAKVRSR